ncbi:MAG: glycosyltransferase family 4 protein [Coprobacter sp.]|nr:glycosyltransferase family 4 protein [Coprobacter sp.]
MHKIIRTSTVPLSLNLFCRGLLCELSQEYEVVALSSPRPELDEIAVREGVRTIAVPMRREIAPLRDLAALFRLVRTFRRERPQLVHSITPKAGLLSMLAARIAGVPVRTHTFTGLLFPTATGFRRRLLMLTDRLTCRCATHIIAEGEGVRNDLLQHRITRKTVQVLGYGSIRGIDPEEYDHTPEVDGKAKEIQETLHPEKHTFTFIFVGRQVHDKGISELTEAFGQLTAEGYDLRLLLVGDEEPTDPLSPETRQHIARNGNIIPTGWQDDVRPLYAAADALVFPSYREGFPNAVLEAGAMSLPSIVTDINGSREIVVDGETGIIVPPRNAGALYRAMKEMIAAPDRARRMGENARRRVIGRYSQQFVRNQLKKFYRSVLP